MILVAVKLFCPHGMLVRLLEIEQAGVQDGISRYIRVIRLDDADVRVQTADNLAGSINLVGSGVIDLVENDDVSEFDLVGQKMDERSGIFFSQ